MNKTWSIIGALFFVAACVVGYFCNFPSASIVTVALAAFGFTSEIIAALNSAKKEQRLNWKTVVTIVLACIAGVLCCIGGLAQNIFAEISAAVLALLTLIFAIKFGK